MSYLVKKYLSEKIQCQKSTGNLARLSSVLAKSTIDLNPHQIQAALYAFNSPLSRGSILADEVGLGKTIEAGIILAQLWAEGKHKILIMCPSSLRKQWQDELQTKFGLESEIWDGPSYLARVNTGENIPLTYDGIFITSYQFIYSHLQLVEKQPWNVVIIDEAHRFRRVYRGRDASKMAYEIREAIKYKPKVLLTATPLQNSLEELYGIASFIDDKLLGSPYSFKTKFVDPIRQNESDSDARLAQLRHLIRGDENQDSDDAISGIINRTLRKQVLEYVPFTDRRSITFDFTPTAPETELYEKVSAYLQRPDVAAIYSTQRNLMILVYRKLLASSSFAISATLERLIENLKGELVLREKEINNIVEEKIIEDISVADLVDETDLEVIEEKVKKTKQRVAQKYTNKDIELEISELQRYLDIAKNITINTKGDQLIKSLLSLFEQSKSHEPKWPEKAVVFTESTRTQEYISRLFKEAGITHTIFNGSNNSPEARLAFESWKKEFPESATIGSVSANMRQALIHEFKTKTKVLLTTEAGSEGLNLQFCNIIINFDLPWNPQRVEQRIGRCHRYGQKYEVIVANFLNTKNHADRRVLELLQDKLNLFDGLFGSSDEVLGSLVDGFDFEKRILEIYQNCKSPDEYDQAFAKLQEKLKISISKTTLQYRKLLLENADQAVSDLFKQTKLETTRVISEFDADLLKLCQYEYKNKITNIDSNLYSFPDFEFPVAFRELLPEEIGKYSRAYREHPIVKKILEKYSIVSEKIISTNFLYSKSNQKISQLDNCGDKEGFIFLWKLKISGVESEDIIVPFVYVGNSDNYKILDINSAHELLSLDTLDGENTHDVLPFSESKFTQDWENWKKPVTDKYKKRNERLFDRESDRINRYYQDFSLRVDDKINKLEIEKVELNRKRDNSSDLDERRKLMRKIQDIDNKLETLHIDQIAQKQKAQELRKKDLSELEVKLEPTIQDELIAISSFKII